MNAPHDKRFTLDLSEADFNRILEEIDRQLASEGVKVPGREIQGWMLFCKHQKLSGISIFDPISQKVMNWFAARYGQRLNLDVDFGNSVLLLQNDILRFRCPYIAGRVYAVPCVELMDRDFGGVKVNQPSAVNILRMIDGITQVYFRSLDSAERNILLEKFVESEVLVARIADTDARPFVAEARADLRISVEQMTLATPQFGPSKWASMQAVEKFLKSYINQRGIEPKRTHEISDLATVAELIGLRSVNRPLLKLAQCSPSVRYQSSLVTKDEAVAAHRASIAICADIAIQLPQSGWRTNIVGRSVLILEGCEEQVPAVLISRTKPK